MILFLLPSFALFPSSRCLLFCMDAKDRICRLFRLSLYSLGGSSGAAMYCALLAAKEFKMTERHRVVVVLPDSVRNYMLV